MRYYALTPRKFCVGRFALSGLFLLAISLPLLAQADPKTGAETEPSESTPQDTFFKHPDDTKWWLSGQANFIFQAHGGFYALYSGPNSLKNTSENAISRVLTLYTGYEFTPKTAVYFDLEEAGWGGISWEPIWSARAGSAGLIVPG